MWLGIIIGLLLGAAFESIQGALALAVIGGVIGAIVKSKDKSPAAKPPDVQRQLHDLQEQLSGALKRINQLEHRLAGTIVPASPLAEPVGAAKPGPLAASPPALAASAVSEAVGPIDEPLALVEAAANAHAEEAPVAAIALGARPATQQEATWHTLEAPSLSAPSWLSAFIARWVTGGNPIVKIGVLILFLGLAFLLRYMTEHTQVPISLRYAGVAAAGVGLLLFGWRWRQRSDSYGLVLQGAGIGVLYLTTLAGMKLHPLIPPEFGFVVLVGVAGCAVLLALLQDSLALAAVAALGGFAAPVLASTGSANHLFFFAYLTVINLGIVATAWFKAWRLLNVIGFACSVFLASAWGAEYYQPSLFGLAEPFLILLFVLYVLVAFLFARRTLADADAAADELSGGPMQQVNYVDASLVFGVPMSTFGLQYLLVRSFENGAAFSALGFGLVYVVLGYALFRNRGKRYALLSETMVALAVIFGSLAIPLGLEGEWTAAAWAVEAAGVYWLGVRQNRLFGRLFALLLLGGAASYFALDLQPGFDPPAINGSWLGCLLLILSTAATYRWVRTAPSGCLRDDEASLRPWLLACSSFFVALMPFLFWSVDSASAALAIIGALAMAGAGRLAERVLIFVGGFYQVLAGLLYLGYQMLVHLGATADLPAFQYAGFWIPVLIALAAFVSARLLARQEDEPLAGVLGGAALFWSALWWALAWIVECERQLVPRTAVLALLAVTLTTALLWRWLARRYVWQQLGRATLAFLPLLALLFSSQMFEVDHPLTAWGVLLWPLALLLHVLLLRDQPTWLSERLCKAAHVAGVWLFLLIAMVELHWRFAAWSDEGPWPMLGWLLAPLAFVASLSSRKLARQWPLSEFREVYAVSAGLPVVVFLLGWVWLNNLLGEGAAPLPYLPLLNPLEIGQIAALLGIVLWWRSLAEPPWFAGRPLVPVALLGASGLAVISSMVLRACHQWGGVPWETHALLSSLLAQSALSIVWSSLAISLMLFGNRTVSRSTWLAGAALIAVVVLKLFLVELAATGSLERIVSFVVVGLLLLLVGYFAPLPPKRASADDEPGAAEGAT